MTLSPARGALPRGWPAAGHSSEQLKAGVHARGYVAETTEKAVEDFYLGCAALSPRSAKSADGQPGTRAHFDGLRSPHGALLVGNPDEVAVKVAAHSEALGGVSRIIFQMDVAGLPHEKHMRAIELLGKSVALALRQKTRNAVNSGV